MLKFADIQPGEWFKRSEVEDDIVYCMKIIPMTNLSGMRIVVINNYGVSIYDEELSDDELVGPCVASFDAGDLLE